MESTPSIASSFKSVFSSVGREHEKPLKQAFYNTGALFFLLISAGVAVSAYYVLEAFLRPLMWAALCGTFLFPFKKASTNLVRDWLRDLEANNKPFFIATALLPFELLRKGFYLVEYVAQNNWKLLLTVFGLVPLFYALVIFHPFYQIFSVIGTVVNVQMYAISLFNSPLQVWSLFLGYILLMFFWKNDEDTVVISYFKKGASMLTWFIVVFYLISLTGSWKLPITTVLVGLIAIGFVEQKKAQKIANAEQSSSLTPSKSHLSVKFVIDNTLTAFGIKKKLTDTPSSTNTSGLSHLEESPSGVDTDGPVEDIESVPKGTSEDVKDEPDAPPPVIPVPITPTKPELYTKAFQNPKRVGRKKKRSSRSDPYFIALFWLFCLNFLWVHLGFFSLLFCLLPLKYVFKFLITTDLVKSKFDFVLGYVTSFYEQRKDVMYPWPVKKVLSFLYSGDQKLVSYMNGAIDKLMSMMIILCLVTMASLASAFFALQVQQESTYLVTVAKDVVNQTILSNKEYLEWLNLNDTDIRKTFDETVHSGYIMARGRMATYFSAILKGKDSNTTYMEHQLTQLMDQIYEAYSGKEAHMKRTKHPHQNKSDNSIASFAPNNLLMNSWNKLKMLTNSSDYAKVFEIFKENLHTLYSVLDSIWLILKGNMNLVMSIITTIFSMLFFSGTYLLNALISCIIFATTLFYLLSSSSKEYKLMELLTGLSMGTKFGESIAKAIQDVFGASLKMATFYFLYTWLTHDAFGANLIFIPAALAAMLGVVPFIGTYWAAIPAALEIWLIQKKGVLSLFLIALHFLPTYVVDTAIYSEIGEGGHPYLTGLAVAGGVYCFGLEGAFFGPFVLCCLIAAFDIYNSIMNSGDVRLSPAKGMSRSMSVIN